MTTDYVSPVGGPRCGVGSSFELVILPRCLSLWELSICGLMGHMVQRARILMSADVRDRLHEADVIGDYEQRPAYQQNDYLGWIERAKRPETREKRIRQMLDELRAGGVYMKMAHPSSAKDGNRAGQLVDPKD